MCHGSQVEARLQELMIITASIAAYGPHQLLMEVQLPEEYQICSTTAEQVM
jgi:hypothetical protein